MNGVEEGPAPPFKVTVADQIRALDRAGHSRAEIARKLGKRYQHVRNVLEGDKVGAAKVEAPKVEAGGPPPKPKSFIDTYLSCRLVVGPGGTLTLPSEIMERLGLKEGGVVMGHVEGDDLILTEGYRSSMRVQARLARLLRGSPSLADELIADRRREASAEMDD